MRPAASFFLRSKQPFGFRIRVGHCETLVSTLRYQFLVAFARSRREQPRTILLLEWRGFYLASFPVVSDSFSLSHQNRNGCRFVRIELIAFIAPLVRPCGINGQIPCTRLPPVTMTEVCEAVLIKPVSVFHTSPNKQIIRFEH